MSSCKCKTCTNVKVGKYNLTTYTDGTRELPPNERVVDDPGIANITVPSTTTFWKVTPPLSARIMDLVRKGGIIEVTVLTGSVRVLEKSMGATGCVNFGEVIAANKKFIVQSTSIDDFNWCAPLGGTVRVEAFA